MTKNDIILFGYGKFGNVIVERLKEYPVDITLVETDHKKRLEAVKNGFRESILIDVTNDEHLKSLPIKSHHKFICAMDDDHLNVYLTLSLKDLYPENQILAISDSMYVTEKLRLAGASKIIDLYAISANRIYNILNKKVATKFLEGFIYKTHEYSFKEIEIPSGSFLDGKMLDEVDFFPYSVILIGLIDRELGDEFIFVTVGKKHKLDSGDLLVFIGRDENLNKFEDAIKKSSREKIEDS
jgi:voltage-gated potassium channel